MILNTDTMDAETYQVYVSATSGQPITPAQALSLLERMVSLANERDEAATELKKCEDALQAEEKETAILANENKRLQRELDDANDRIIQLEDAANETP